MDDPSVLRRNQVVAAGAHRLEDRLDQIGTVLGIDAQSVADLVRQAAPLQVERGESNLLLGARLRQGPAFDHGSVKRIASAVDRFGRRAVAVRGGVPVRRAIRGRSAVRSRRVCLPVAVSVSVAVGVGFHHRQRFPVRHELLQLGEGLFAAGRALGQVGVFALGDRFGVRLAQVTARTAIELGHGRHERPLKRPTFGELQPFVHRQVGIVPGEVFRLRRRRGGSGRLDAGAVHAERAGEEAVQPGPLRLRKRSGFREESDGHDGDPAESKKAFNCSVGWRRTNSMNRSAGSSRCFR
jgi:hypothetical protein